MKRILIVDDDVEYSATLSDILKESFEVSTIDHTEGAVDYIRENRPDLVILDVMFPENPSAGFDLAREIRKVDELRDLPIVFLTSINQEFPMDFSPKDLDSEWMPVQDFIEKPGDFDELIAKINKLLGKS